MTDQERLTLLNLLKSFEESLLIRGSLKLHQRMCFDQMKLMIHEEIHQDNQSNIDSIRT